MKVQKYWKLNVIKIQIEVVWSKIKLRMILYNKIKVIVIYKTYRAVQSYNIDIKIIKKIKKKILHEYVIIVL